MSKILAIQGEAEIEAAKDDGSSRSFRMLAYTGAAMQFSWSRYPVVVDLAGMTISKKPRPILLGHSAEKIVGHSTKIGNSGKDLILSGVVSGVGAHADTVVESADRGFPWQSSIGASVSKMEHIDSGKTVIVNGRKFTGPIDIVRASTLSEVSFVALGADDDTEAKMVAGVYLDTESIENPNEKDNKMSNIEANADPAPEVVDSPVVTVDLVASARAAAAEEMERIASIQKVCADHGDIAAKAIREGWTRDRAELEVLRAARPQAPSGFVARDESVTSSTLEAAALQAAGIPDLDKHYDGRALEAADKRWHGRLGLQELILEAAWANGYQGRSFKQDPRGVLRAAFSLEAQGFSTVDIAGILSNVANKFLLAGFMSVEAAWQMISDIQSVSDFKTITRYRLTGDDVYEKVAPGGEIKHGTLGEESFTNKADTFAKMLAVTRQDLINDDLGALTTVPRKLGRGAGLKLNSIFWTEFLADHATFFPTDGSEGNYVGGTASALSIAGLNGAVTKMRRQTDKDGNPISVDPRYLLVPPELEATALELNRSTTVNTGGSATSAQVPNANIFQGRYPVVVSQYLTAAKVWYLLADPQDLAMIETVFLNGQRSPTIETADVDFSTLGIQMRGYHDFGVSKQDKRAAVKNKGEN